MQRAHSKVRILAVGGVMLLTAMVSAQYTLPYFNDFESSLQLTIDPPAPVGGGPACGNCATSPCLRARGEVRSGFQSSIGAGGSQCMVLDSLHRGGIAEWPSGLPQTDCDDPDTDWPSNLPEHHGSASLVLDTTGYTAVTLSFDYNFVVNQWHQSQFTVEVDDGSGWQYAIGPTMGSVPGAGHPNTYVPDECGICPGSCPACNGIYEPTAWIHEVIDLSTFTPGPAFTVRFRFVVRHNFDGSGCATDPNAVLIDNLHVDGITQGLVIRAPFPPAAVTVNSDATGVEALPFFVSSVQQATDYDSLTIGASGTGNDMDDIADIHLYEDVDGSQTLTPADVLLQSVGSGFPADDGSHTFTLASPVSLATGQQVDYLLLLDLAGTASAGEDFIVSVTGVNITAPPGSLIAGLPAGGSVLTIADGDLTVGLGPDNPVGPLGIIGQTDALVAQLELLAAGSTVTVDQVVLDASGTGDEPVGISQVRLVLEDPATTNGVPDPGEVVVATATYGVDDDVLTVPLTPPVEVTVLATEQLLVLYDVTMAAAAPGVPETYCITFDDPADVLSDALTTTIAGGSFTQCLEVSDRCPRTVCGDCSLDGAVTIVDALFAAQHAAVLTTLTGEAFSNCNVMGVLEPFPGAEVNILDALIIAQVAAGLTPTYACC